MRSIIFDFPLALPIGLALTLGLLGWSIRSFRKHGLSKSRIALLTTLRGATLLLLVFLGARPVWVEKQREQKERRNILLLMDKSESMSLQENEQTRYARAIAFTREHLLPGFEEAKLKVQPFLFAEDAEPVDGPKLVAAKADGKRSNLGRAIARALESSPNALAVIALTDGAANEKSDNMRALSALLDSHVPFIGIGFGSDTGVKMLSLQQVEAPPIAAPNTRFEITAHLETMNVNDLPAFDLVLLRDGHFLQKKTVVASSGSRFWLESFRVEEKSEGAHNYEIQLAPPNLPGLARAGTTGSVAVRIASERELRVLYVQGALTWDYKFIAMALHGDPTIKLTGLTRTSSKSVFRQNVENAGELLEGFPKTIEGIAPFRVIVLSNLRPVDLSTEQQELLAKFSGELGGGVLMIGGPETFDSSWRDSRLEKLLPVIFSENGGVQGLDRPFQLELTDEALQHPVFQISDGGALRRTWNALPKFHQYGRVDSAKPGAQVWALHQTDEGPKGRRILMASQHYGSGLSAILTVQNFWLWRLAKDSEPQEFDRFWRQLFRFLAESSRQDVAIHIADQELRPDVDIRLVLEKEPSPKDVTTSKAKFTARVEDAQKKILAEQTLELPTGRPVDFSFHPKNAGLYTVSILNELKQPVATRSIEIRELNVELQNSARNMENLQQWASLSDGLALRAEDCRDGAELLAQLKPKLEQARQSPKVRAPIGVNGWTFAFLLGCLSLEWGLRKRFGMA